MQVSKKVLSIPPYISVSWGDVISLRIDNEELLVSLNDGTLVRVPNLNPTQLSQIFAAHSQHLEDRDTMPDFVPSPFSSPFPGGGQVIGLPLRFGPDGMEGLDAAMAHDPSQSSAPDLPPEILEKIAGISEVLGVESVASLPKPEQGCNCFHCQIARAIQDSEEEELVIEEEVSDEELKFREWDISQTDDRLYTVTNPLDANERYSVYLGEPLGCTCGQKDCEHIKAVLQS
jgi:hypothetical protein